MKFTAIEMDWTDDGAFVKTTMDINCPRCRQNLPANTEHRCGDKQRSSKPKAKRAKRGGAAA